jgi:hypothetical protein
MKYISSLLLLCLSLVAWSQETPVLENNPGSLRWYKIKTPHFNILYPRGFETQAQRMANTLEHIYEPEAKSLGVKPRRISVVLQNQSALSNGFVSMLPRRSEFYAMPTQNYNFTGTNDWLDLLAAHEYRHIVQFQRARTGFTNLMYYVFGSATFSALAQTSVPQWFWEGDAVNIETAFTTSGRGRIPYFNMVFRTNLLEGRTFNYHKQYLRSYKHNIPDHYVLGYHMVNYLRRTTGEAQVWDDITRKTWQVPFIPFAFSNAIKKESGRYVTQLYDDMAADLKKQWTDEVAGLTLTSFETTHKRKNTAYTDYKFPVLLANGSLVAMKEGIGDVEQFVQLDANGEKRLLTLGFLNESGMLSAAGNRIVWNEQMYDPRYLVKNYSVIKMFDTESGRTKILSKRTRYAGAALSPDQSKVVTVETNTEYQSQLVVLDTTGVVLKRFDNPANDFYSMPRWSTDGQEIVVLKTSRNQRSVVVLNPETGEEKTLLEAGSENVGHPVLYGQYLFYNSPVSGIDNIYAMDRTTGQRYQVTSSKYGAFNPVVSADGGTLYYNEQTRNGLDVVRMAVKPSEWKSDYRTKPVVDLVSSQVEQEGHADWLSGAPTNTYETKRYHTTAGIINPYSWGAVVNTSFTGAEIGIASQDILSTTSVRAGYLYDVYEKTGSWRAGVSYQKYYPILDVQVLYGNREDKFTAFGSQVDFEWKETTAEAGARIPLVLSRSRFFRQLEFGNYIGFTRTSGFNNTVRIGDSLVYEGTGRFVPFEARVQRPDGLDTVTLAYIYPDQLNSGDLIYNRFYLSYYNLQKLSHRDFLYRWGQAAEFELYSTPYKGDFNGQLFAFRSIAYFPGIGKHHVLYARYNYQRAEQAVDVNLYQFRNRIFKPRGFSFPFDEQFYSVSLNYALPLWYPDIAFGPVLNVQRVKANLFYDYGQGVGTQYFYGVGENAGEVFSRPTDATYTSFGVEVTFDLNIMRLLPKVELGFRYINRQENQYNSAGNVFEFIIGNIGF